MRKLAVCALVIVVLAAGCSLMPAKFDHVEQAKLNDLRQNSLLLKAACGTSGVVSIMIIDLSRQTEWLTVYLEYSDSAAMKEAWKQAITILPKAQGSMLSNKVYCQETAQNLADSFERLMATVGRRSK